MKKSIPKIVSSRVSREVAMANETLEHSNTRIQLICDKIRTETLEPAKDQAQTIVEQAKKEAEAIRERAKLEAEKIHAETKKQQEKEKQIFQSSLEQAAKQTIELLKQKIEKSLFNPQIHEWVVAELGGEKSHVRLIEVIVEAIQKEGVHTNLGVRIPQHFSVDAINAQLTQKILEHLKNHTVELTDIAAGVQVHMANKHLTIDISHKTIEEIITSFIHKGFRKVFFT